MFEVNHVIPDIPRSKDCVDVREKSLVTIQDIAEEGYVAVTCSGEGLR